MRRLSLALYVATAALVLASTAYCGEPFDVDSLQALQELQGAPRAPSKVEWSKGRVMSLRFESPRAFEDDALWALLDWAGGASGWMEIDAKGNLPASVKPVIKGASQSWFRQSPGTGPLVATLRGQASAALEVRAIPALAKEPRLPLECRFDGTTAAFDDFVLENSGLCELAKDQTCKLTHREDARLKVELSRKRLSMVLRTPDAEPFPVVPGFERMADQEQKEQIDDYRSYFAHEYTMMVRAFVETTPGLFSWQVWDWLARMDEGMVSRAAIRALLESGQRPGNVDVFKASCKDGRRLRLWSDGQGTMGMVLE